MTRDAIVGWCNRAACIAGGGAVVAGAVLSCGVPLEWGTRWLLIVPATLLLIVLWGGYQLFGGNPARYLAFAGLVWLSMGVVIRFQLWDRADRSVGFDSGRARARAQCADSCVVF